MPMPGLRRMLDALRERGCGGGECRPHTDTSCETNETREVVLDEFAHHHCSLRMMRKSLGAL